VDKFNVEVLARAERGYIDGLDRYSPPAPSPTGDWLPLITPNDNGFNTLRPTPHDIKLFTTTATNVFLSVCSQEGIELSKETSTPVTSQMPMIERLAGEALHAASPAQGLEEKEAQVDLNAESLRAELARHYPPDEIEDWYTIIKCSATATSEFYVRRAGNSTLGHNSGTDLVECYPILLFGMSVLEIGPSWEQILSDFLLADPLSDFGGMDNKIWTSNWSPRMSNTFYENWGRARGALIRLQKAIQLREGLAALAPRPHVVDQVRYFFLDPRIVDHLNYGKKPFEMNGIFWNARHDGYNTERRS
jgi:hypothetical protein